MIDLQKLIKEERLNIEKKLRKQLHTCMTCGRQSFIEHPNPCPLPKVEDNNVRLDEK